MSKPFELLKTSTTSAARRGVLHTPHGDLETPFFMPIATKGAVKTLSSMDVERLGSPIVLANTYHLMLRPGMDVIESMGGLHKFMGWDGAILTDSGGYQVFSLADRRHVTDEGVQFLSPIDGSKHVLTPESSMDIQRTLGSDIVMCFDEVIGLPASDADIATAVDRTDAWAKRCRDRFESTRDSSLNPGAMLFGIVQGGTNSELRQRSAEGLLKIGFDGYAIGGLSVGEPFEDAIKTLDALMPLIPKDKPRYFMGGAQPDQLVSYVERGIDMFDCVLPTRNARHGHLYRWVHDDLSKPDFYEVVNITNAKWKGSGETLKGGGRWAVGGGTEGSSTMGFDDELSRFTMGYLHHLFDTQEMLAYRLATIVNVAFYLELFRRLRERGSTR
jgi:queuine tRNA-ribosyltransferase